MPAARLGSIGARKQAYLVAEAPEQVAQKRAVKAVLRPVQSICGRSRSMAGETPTTACNWRGASAPSSPASFSIRFPPIE